MSEVELVVVGQGRRARAWAEVAAGSGVLRVVGQVGRVDEALARWPGAAVAVALPPRAGLEAALALAEAGRPAVVEAPLGLALGQAALPEGAAGVRVAHGWVTLSGRAFCERFVGGAEVTRAEIEVRGLPEAREGDPEECLWHALALARRVAPGARVVGARQVGASRFEVALEAGFPVALRVVTSGARVDVRLEGARAGAQWRWEDGAEAVTVRPARGAAKTQRRPATAELGGGEARALGQLAGGEAAGDSLVEAAEVARLTAAALEALPGRLAPGRRRFATARAAMARGAGPLEAFGLRGEVPAAAAAPALDVGLPSEEAELWLFRAGLKPVAFLTVRPGEEARAVAPFADGGGPVHVERRERRVEVGAQDAWVDRRDRGEPRVELYVAREAELARRAARLQAEGDPSAQLRQMGALMGYPPCCVEAFAAQDDRANNTRNRYATAGRTRAPGPWPWELANLSVMLLPFYPCRYDCPAALAQARAALGELERAHPGAAARLRAGLGRPVLYFDHDHQLVFDGAVEADGAVRHRGVAVPGPASRALARFGGALALGDRLRLDEARLSVWRGDALVFELSRTDPGLGFVAPFG